MSRLRATLAVSLFSAVVSVAAWLGPQAAEVTTEDVPIAFKSGVNLVQVPVVVRDNKGHAVGNLVVDDFLLFDNGKPRMISKFTVEKLAAGSDASPSTAGQKNASVETPDIARPAGMPDRFVAYLFDDLHMTLGELTYTRDAARRQIDSTLHATERAAIFTTSGRQTMDFTADKEKLHAALDAIDPRGAAAAKDFQQIDCPPVTYFEADLIVNQSDDAALGIATTDALVCANLDPHSEIPLAKVMAKTSAIRTLKQGDRDTASSLDSLRNTIGKVASAPGQRTIVLVSPGFLVLDYNQEDETRLIDHAVRSGIVIGTLDARGLYTMSAAGSASERTLSVTTVTAKSQHNAIEAKVQADLLWNLAAGTGGTFYKGTNDYDDGFARTAAAPEYLYVLGFNQVDLKLDGKFHNLKVALKNSPGLSLQARIGYYAPSYSADPVEQAKQQIEETFFSRQELNDLPAELQTDYFKAANGQVTLSAVARIDVKKLSYRREADRNQDDVTVVTGVFDNDGNYVTGVQKVLKLRLLDASLRNPPAAGIPVKSSFTVQPGRYVVRMVVRDSQGQLMSAQNSSVDIP